LTHHHDSGSVTSAANGGYADKELHIPDCDILVTR